MILLEVKGSARPIHVRVDDLTSSEREKIRVTIGLIEGMVNRADHPWLSSILAACVMGIVMAIVCLVTGAKSMNSLFGAGLVGLPLMASFLMGVVTHVVTDDRQEIDAAKLQGLIANSPRCRDLCAEYCAANPSFLKRTGGHLAPIRSAT